MAGRPPGKPDLSGYNYGAISSLVLTADRSVLPRRDKEPDGAPTSLVGRIDPNEMGSRVLRAQPKDMDKKKKKALAAAAAEGNDEQRRERKRAMESGGFGYTDIIEATQGVEGLTYRPRTAETKEVYELMLSIVHMALGDQAQDIVRSAADVVLESLKQDNVKDFDKKREVEGVLGPITGEQFSQLLSLSKKITDWVGDGDEDVGIDPDMERKDAQIDDEVGVAVVFDEEEQEEEEDAEGYEVREESSGDENDGDNDDARETGADAPVDDSLLIGRETRDKAQNSQKDIISPHSIDGFWVQRQISEVYPDPVTAADKAASVLSILGSESSLRDCENQLMELFDYQSHHIIQVFIKQWCRRTGERWGRHARKKGVGWILRELAGGGKETKERVRRDGRWQYGAKIEVPKTATLAPGSTGQPQAYLGSREHGVPFSQGGHLMKCKLPEGSLKRSKKGYEEIHVPAPTSKPATDGELVAITALPSWARAAFTVPRLNRVQSKLYPVAFGSEEPILLCAPTGAGKVCF